MNLLDTPTPGQRNPDGMPPEWSDRPAAIAALVIALALLFALFAPPALGQIGSDQLKLKTNGGLGGDAARSLGIEVYRGTSGPASPETGGAWCDTNTTPCTLKLYDGDSWEVVAPAANITTQADASSLPGTPSDGQLVYMRSCRCLWIYDNTNAWWVRLDARKEQAGADVVETFGATTITNPTTAPSVSATSGGSATAGTHVCAYTFVNSTGGETLPSTSSSSVTIGSPNFTYSFTGVLTGGTGTTARRIYCSLANATTPLYWVAEIADNTTTTATSTLADASFRNRAPGVNYSGALPTDWAVDNWDTSGSGSGGCGSTGSSVWCVQPRRNAYASNATTDTVIRLRRSITTYQDVAFTIRWRIVNAGEYAGADNQYWMGQMGTGGLRYGDANNAIAETLMLVPNGPVSTAAHATWARSYRTAAAGSRAGNGTISVAGPPNDFPFWAISQSTGAPYYRSLLFVGTKSDGPFHSPAMGNGTTDATYGQGIFSGGAPPSRWELPLFGGSTTYANAIEIDSWSLTQD